MSPKQEQGHLSVVVFRLGQEWLALNTKFFKQVIHSKLIHRLPRRSNAVFLGLVNFNGRLQPCINLHALMEIECISRTDQAAKLYLGRMIILEEAKEYWVFPVDEVDRIYQWNLAHLKNMPANFSACRSHYSQGVYAMPDKNVTLIDDELLFFSLNRIVA